MSEELETVTPAAEPEAAVEEKTRKPSKRLTTAEWLEIEGHWAYGTMSGREMEAKYGITSAAIRMHFQKLMDSGVPIARNSKRHLLAGKTAAAVGTAAAGAASSAIIGAFASKRRERIEQSKTSLYNQSQLNQIILSNLQKSIADPTSGKTAASCDEEFKAILRVERILQTMIANRWTLLDVENDIDESAMPKLIFEDMTAEDIAKAQQGSEEDDDLDMDSAEEPEDIVVEDT